MGGKDDGVKKRKNASLKQRVALGLVCGLIVSYALYHLVSLFGEELSTYAAGVTTETTSLNYNGYLFRDETVLTSEHGGVVDYAVPDGTKVGRGEAMATVYEYGTPSDRSRLRRIDEQIAVLEHSTADALSGLEMSEVKQSVRDSYTALVKQLAEGETGGLSQRAEAMLIGLNQMNGLAKQESAEGLATLSELQALRRNMLEQAGKGVTYRAEQSGYFYSRTDGYESVYTMEAAENLDADSFYRLIAQKPKSQTDGKTPYGKFCTDSEWILVLPVAADEKEYFEIGGVYEGLFEENGQTSIPLTLERVEDAAERGVALLFFRGDRLPETFVFHRVQSVRLEVESISGIYVPKHIVTRTDGFRGVYVLRGSVVHFRYIEILYEGSDYYLVKEGVERDGDRTYLQVNDMVILNGKNLFDGRVMD